MTAESIVAAVGIYAGAFVVGAISAVFPLASIELFLVGITVAARPLSVAAVAILVVLAAAGQLAGKLPIYAAARGAVALSGPQRERVERLRARVRRWRHGRDTPHAVLAASAIVGVPPFSIMATAAGVLAIRVRAFSAIVFAGRALRFAIVIAATGFASR